MVKFGDIEIPWVTDKDTSISKDIVEKNFVGQPPNVYELTPNLESGTYSFILNEKVQNKGESFEVQEDAVLSMVSRHGTEFPFASASDSGYIVVESASVNTFPSLEIKEAEVDIRFLDDEEYYSGIRAEPKPIRRGAYDAQASPVETIVALPSAINPLNLTSTYQIDAEDGSVDLYPIDSTTIFEFDEASDRQLSQTQSICRLYTSSNGQRVYTGDVALQQDARINNSIVRSVYYDNEAHFDYYNGTTWQGIGEVRVSFGDGYASVNTNDEVEITFVNGYQSGVYRGIPAVSYTINKQDHFYFIFDDDNFTEMSLEDYYGHWQDANGNDVIVVNPFEDGEFYTYSSSAAIESLVRGTEYTIFVGIVPDGINVSDYARYLYNFGNRSRTFTQK